MSRFVFGSLFAGIGMIDHAAELLGGVPLWMCEKEPFCQQVLALRFPGVPIFDDVRELGGGLRESFGQPDVLIGGFPCQNISGAGRGEGIYGDRSILWFEYLRLSRCSVRASS
jgi:DNA (cytosine-5)-methyltransferase 1